MENEKQQDFFDKLRDKYTAEDFTGNLGVLLADRIDIIGTDEVNNTMNFIQDIYNIAKESL